VTSRSTTSRQMTLPGLPASTPLQELQGGTLPSSSQPGPTTDLFGRAHAPASPSPQPEKAKHQAMNATSGPSGSGLSEQFDRQSSLASRLKRQLDGVGSTLFTLTWKRKVTPYGRPYYQLAASGHRTSDSDCGSWPTPTAGTPAQNGYNEAGNTDASRKTVELSPWPTPCQQDGPKGGPGQGTDRLPAAAATASWATPTARDGRSEHGSPEMMRRRRARPEGKQLSNQVLGAISSGSPAQTESKGQLNPAFSLWLMGYPADAWLNCAPQATRSSRKSRRSSSRPPCEGNYPDDNGTLLRSRATEAGSLPVASRGDRVIPDHCAGSNPAGGNAVGQSGSPPHSLRCHRDSCPCEGAA